MLYLRANGKDALMPFLPVAERFLFDRFSLKTTIRVIPGNTAEGELLFAETEKLRREAMKNVPAPAAPRRYPPARAR